MSAHITIDEYGLLQSRNEWNRVVRLPEDLSSLITLAVDKMESLDPAIYYPDASKWHWGHSRKRLCRINHAGAIMAGELGVRPHMICDPGDFEEDLEYATYYKARLHAVDAAYRYCDIERGVLLAQGYEDLLWDAFDDGRLYADFRKSLNPDKAAVVSKWRQYADHVDPDALFKGWDQARAANVVMREMAHDLREVGW